MEQQYAEDYQFPLPIQDMNNEIIARLDDDSLYQLCQTNKQMARTCLSDNIWALRANSPLAPLFIVRNQYKNWMDFYANVRKDYLYYVTITGNENMIYSYAAVFTSIRAALRTLFDNMNHNHASKIRQLTVEQLVAIPLALDDKHGTITLIRKRTNFKGVGGIHGPLLYSIGMNNFLDTGILTYPDLVDVPVLRISWGTNQMGNSRISFVNFNEQNLKMAMSLPGRKSFELAFNNVQTALFSIGSMGWRMYKDKTTWLVIINGAVLDIEEIDKDKYYVASVPQKVDYQGTTIRFTDLTRRNYSDTPDGINNLRWYLDSYGIFYNIEDMQYLLTKNPDENISA